MLLMFFVDSPFFFFFSSFSSANSLENKLTRHACTYTALDERTISVCWSAWTWAIKLILLSFELFRCWLRELFVIWKTTRDIACVCEIFQRHILVRCSRVKIILSLSSHVDESECKFFFLTSGKHWIKWKIYGADFHCSAAAVWSFRREIRCKHSTHISNEKKSLRFCCRKNVET